MGGVSEEWEEWLGVVDVAPDGVAERTGGEGEEPGEGMGAHGVYGSGRVRACPGRG